MNQTFNMDLVKLTCDVEQSGEPGSDEVYLVGFGISGNGQRFAPKIVNIGSFSDGDVTPDDYRANLFALTLDKNETVVATAFVVFERDSGDIAASLSAITDDFNRVMDRRLQMSQPFGDYKHIHSFTLTMLIMPDLIQDHGISFWNDDDVDKTSMYIDHFASSFAEPLAQRTKHHFRVATGTGIYFLEFEARFSPPEPVFDSGVVRQFGD